MSRPAHPPASPVTTPSADVEVTASLVAALLEAQHPDLAGLSLAPVESGWDNAMFRLGARLAVRLPRRRVAAALIEHEQRWLPVLAPRLPVAVPAPVRVGRPGTGYPWHWSVVPWLPGAPADEPGPALRAGDLVRFLQRLHRPAPAQAPRNPVRGVALRRRAPEVAARLQRLQAAAVPLPPAVLTAWRAARVAPEDDTRCWVHGDLHPRNVLVDQGAITAVIDWGDLCGGDRATDLAAVWMLLDSLAARREAIAAYGRVPRATWLRALGWAVSFGTVLLETGLADHPRHAAMGRAILRRVGDGPGPAELG